MLNLKSSYLNAKMPHHQGVHLFSGQSLYRNAIEIDVHENGKHPTVLTQDDDIGAVLSRCPTCVVGPVVAIPAQLQIKAPKVPGCMVKRPCFTAASHSRREKVTQTHTFEGRPSSAAHGCIPSKNGKTSALAKALQALDSSSQTD